MPSFVSNHRFYTLFVVNSTDNNCHIVRKGDAASYHARKLPVTELKTDIHPQSAHKQDRYHVCSFGGALPFLQTKFDERRDIGLMRAVGHRAGVVTN